MAMLGRGVRQSRLSKNNIAAEIFQRMHTETKQIAYIKVF